MFTRGYVKGNEFPSISLPASPSTCRRRCECVAGSVGYLGVLEVNSPGGRWVMSSRHGVDMGRSTHDDSYCWYMWLWCTPTRMAMMTTIVIIAITIIIVIYNLLSWHIMAYDLGCTKWPTVLWCYEYCGCIFLCHGLNFGSIRRSPEFNSRPMQDGN